MRRLGQRCGVSEEPPALPSRPCRPGRPPEGAGTIPAEPLPLPGPARQSSRAGRAPGTAPDRHRAASQQRDALSLSNEGLPSAACEHPGCDSKIQSACHEPGSVSSQSIPSISVTQLASAWQGCTDWYARQSSGCVGVRDN